MAQSAQPARRPRIVVGVDASEAAKNALRWAARQAEMTRAVLEVVMAWQAPVTSYGWALPVPSDNGVATQAERALHEMVHNVLGSAQDGDVVEILAEGPPAPTLLRVAEGAELLVVGTRGHGPLVGALIGSVSEKCTTHAPCPVVVVRHAPEAA